MIFLLLTLSGVILLQRIVPFGRPEVYTLCGIKDERVCCHILLCLLSISTSTNSIVVPHGQLYLINEKMYKEYEEVNGKGPF